MTPQRGLASLAGAGGIAHRAAVCALVASARVGRLVDSRQTFVRRRHLTKIWIFALPLRHHGGHEALSYSQLTTVMGAGRGDGDGILKD